MQKLSIIIITYLFFSTLMAETVENDNSNPQTPIEQQEYKSAIVNEIKALANDTGTLVDNLRNDGGYGLYIRMGATFSPNLNRNAFYQQTGFGIILGQNWSIGVSSSRLRTKISMPDSIKDDLVQFDYEGVEFGYTLFPKSLFHVTSKIGLARGHLFPRKDSPENRKFDKKGNPQRRPEWDKMGKRDEKNGRNDRKGMKGRGPKDNKSKLFIVTPEIVAEINITSWLRFYSSVGYRFVFGEIEEAPTVKKSDLYNYTISSGLMAGLF